MADLLLRLIPALGMWALIAVAAQRGSGLWCAIARRAPPVVYGLGWLSLWSYHVDDAGISYAYAHNLAHGLGLRAQATGPVVEGYSNPSWTLLLALGEVLGVSAPLASKLLQLGLGLATLVLVRRLVVACGFAPWVGDSAAALAATNAAFVVWSAAGLENALLAAALLAAVVLARAGKLSGCAALAALVSLTRPEGPLLALVLVATLLWSGKLSWRGRAVVLLLATAPWLLHEALRWFYFGDLVPNTYHAKIGGTGIGWRLLHGLHYLQQSMPLPLLALAPLAVVGAALDPAGRRLLGMVLPLLAGGTLFVLYSGGDWMSHGRFVSHLMPLVVVLAAPGIYLLARRLVSRHQRLRSWATPAAVAALCLAGLLQVPDLEAAVKRPTLPLANVQRDRQRLVAMAASWCGAVPPSVASPDIGGLLWPPGKLRVIDIAGLIDREAAARRFETDYWIRRFLRDRPQLVLVHGPWTAMSGLDDAAMARAGYRLHCRALSPRAPTDPWERRFPPSIYRRFDCRSAPSRAGLEATLGFCFCVRGAPGSACQQVRQAPARKNSAR